MKGKINIAIILTIMASLLFSVCCKNRVQEESSSGTVGQVRKYRKEQMTEKDILLRSEIMKDTAKLDEIIKGLLIFSAYAANLEKSLEMRLPEMESVKGFDNTYDSFVSDLTDFKDFLKNNNEVLASTIRMLADIYTDTISESSADVENNLRAFASYVRQLEEKDSILVAAVNNIDVYVTEKEQGIIDQTEIDKLKNIRDEMLIRVVQQAYMFDDPAALKTVGNRTVYDVNNLKDIYALDQLGIDIQEAISTGGVASLYVQGSTVIGSSSSGAPVGGGPDGGGALPPVHPPYNPEFGGVVPQVVQGFVIGDAGFIGQLDQLRSDGGLGVVVDSFIQSVSNNVTASTGQLSDVEPPVLLSTDADHLSEEPVINSNEILSSIVLYAQNFIGYAESVSGGGPVLGPPN